MKEPPRLTKEETDAKMVELSKELASDPAFKLLLAAYHIIKYNDVPNPGYIAAMGVTFAARIVCDKASPFAQMEFIALLKEVNIIIDDKCDELELAKHRRQERN